MKLKLIVAASLMGALLVGCGGGGGGETPPEQNPAQPTSAIDKYVGSWVSPCEVIPGVGSDREVVTLSKTSDTTMSLAGVETNFSTSDCTGASTDTSYSGAYRFEGTKTIGSDVVDKFIVTSLIPTEKLVIKLSGTQMFFGDETAGAPFDAEGYADRLETVAELTKQ